MPERIYLSPPHTGAEERRFVGEAFDTNWIAPVGPHITWFEENLSRYIGRSPAAVLSSGTAALHLALVALGVQNGDEVICQSFTFCGSANPIRYQGAWPVFVDSEPVTWNMDPVILEAAISDRIRHGKRPSAIVYVHLYGMPARVDAIREIAGRYEIPLIEDAAEALGSRYNGQLTGNFGDWSFFSFNGNKIITTSGGGALFGPSGPAVEEVRFLATQARDPAPHYEHSRLGYNYRMSNVCAAIGRGQLMRIEERVAQRRAVFDRYREGLSDLVEFQTEPPGCRSNRWLTCILLPGAREVERIRESLESADIECRPLWKPMHRQPVYREAPCYIQGISDGLFARGLCLPSGSGLRPDQQEIIIRRIRDCLQQG